METTPNDLRQQQFEIKFRGYNADDVEVFRELAANALEEARAEVLKRTEENKHLSARLKNLIDLEDTLKAAILEAQKNSESTLGVAKKEAEFIITTAEKEKEMIIREAQNLRDEVIADMHRRMGKLVNDINKIRFIRNNYLIQLKHLVAAQAEMIDRAMAEDEEDETAKSSEMPKKPEFHPPEPMTSPDMNEAPEMHVKEARPESNPDNLQEEPPVDKPSDYPEAEEKPAPPSDDASDDDEWKHLKEQLSEE